MATGPRLAATPLGILTPDLDREQPLLNKIWGPLLCGTAVFIGTCFSKIATRRPMLSGIQNHIVYSAIGAWFGQWADDYRKYYHAEQDAVLRHYIELHPEDFPPFKRTMYKNVFEPWVPIR